MDLDLATQKKLADIQAAATPILQQLRVRNETAKASALRAAANEFKAHFEKEGFLVVGGYPARMTAKYQHLEFVLEFDEQERVYYWAILKLQQTNPKKPETKVALVRKGSKGPRVTTRIGHPDPIADAEARLAEAQEALDGPGIEFDFQIEASVNGSNARAVKNYASLRDVLLEHYK